MGLLYGLLDDKNVVKYAKEWIGNDEIEHIQVAGWLDVKWRYITELDSCALRVRYFGDDSVPVYKPTDDKITETVIDLITYKITFKGEKLFLCSYEYPNFAGLTTYIFFKKSKGLIAELLVNEFKKRIKKAKQLWIWGNRFIDIDSFDCSKFILPNHVANEYNKLIKPQLTSKTIYNHVLFYSPPGYGKTAYCRYMAQQNPDWTFIVVNPVMLCKPTHILSVLEDASAYKPAVVFFEDIDSVGKIRSETGRFNPYLGALLNGLDGTESLDGIMVMASTNDQHVLDPALLRSGRLGIHIPFEYSYNEKVNILNSYLGSNYQLDEVRFILKAAPSDIRVISKVVMGEAQLKNVPITVSLIKKITEDILSEEKVKLDWRDFVADAKSSELGMTGSVDEESRPS